MQPRGRMYDVEASKYIDLTLPGDLVAVGAANCTVVGHTAASNTTSNVLDFQSATSILDDWLSQQQGQEYGITTGSLTIADAAELLPYNIVLDVDRPARPVAADGGVVMRSAESARPARPPAPLQTVTPRAGGHQGPHVRSPCKARIAAATDHAAAAATAVMSQPATRTVGSVAQPALRRSPLWRSNSRLRNGSRTAAAGSSSSTAVAVTTAAPAAAPAGFGRSGSAGRPRVNLLEVLKHQQQVLHHQQPQQPSRQQPLSRHEAMPDLSPGAGAGAGRGAESPGSPASTKLRTAQPRSGSPPAGVSAAMAAPAAAAAAGAALACSPLPVSLGDLPAGALRRMDQMRQKAGLPDSPTAALTAAAAATPLAAWLASRVSDGAGGGGGSFTAALAAALLDERAAGACDALLSAGVSGPAAPSPPYASHLPGRRPQHWGSPGGRVGAELGIGVSAGKGEPSPAATQQRGGGDMLSWLQSELLRQHSGDEAVPSAPPPHHTPEQPPAATDHDCASSSSFVQQLVLLVQSQTAQIQGLQSSLASAAGAAQAEEEEAAAAGGGSGISGTAFGGHGEPPPRQSMQQLHGAGGGAGAGLAARRLLSYTGTHDSAASLRRFGDCLRGSSGAEAGAAEHGEGDGGFSGGGGGGSFAPAPSHRGGGDEWRTTGGGGGVSTSGADSSAREAAAAAAGEAAAALSQVSQLRQQMFCLAEVVRAMQLKHEHLAEHMQEREQQQQLAEQQQAKDASNAAATTAAAERLAAAAAAAASRDVSVPPWSSSSRQLPDCQLFEEPDVEPDAESLEPPQTPDIHRAAQYPQYPHHHQQHQQQQHQQLLPGETLWLEVRSLRQRLSRMESVQQVLVSQHGTELEQQQRGQQALRHRALDEHRVLLQEHGGLLEALSSGAVEVAGWRHQQERQLAGVQNRLLRLEEAQAELKAAEGGQGAQGEQHRPDGAQQQRQDQQQQGEHQLLLLEALSREVAAVQVDLQRHQDGSREALDQLAKGMEHVAACLLSALLPPPAAAAAAAALSEGSLPHAHGAGEHGHGADVSTPPWASASVVSGIPPRARSQAPASPSSSVAASAAGSAAGVPPEVRRQLRSLQREMRRMRAVMAAQVVVAAAGTSGAAAGKSRRGSQLQLQQQQQREEAAASQRAAAAATAVRGVEVGVEAGGGAMHEQDLKQQHAEQQQLLWQQLRQLYGDFMELRSGEALMVEAQEALVDLVTDLRHDFDDLRRKVTARAAARARAVGVEANDLAQGCCPAPAAPSSSSDGTAATACEEADMVSLQEFCEAAALAADEEEGEERRQQRQSGQVSELMAAIQHVNTMLSSSLSQALSRIQTQGDEIAELKKSLAEVVASQQPARDDVSGPEVQAVRSPHRQ